MDQAPCINLHLQHHRACAQSSHAPKPGELLPVMQTELKPETSKALQAAVPGLTDDLLQEMMVSPLRQFDTTIVQEPLVYRLYEVISPGCMHPSHARTTRAWQPS